MKQRQDGKDPDIRNRNEGRRRGEGRQGKIREGGD